MDEVNTENKPQPSPEPNGRRDGGVEAAELDATVAHLRTMNEQLRTALGSRVVIEQAKGILAERLGLSIDGAFALLRRAARTSRSSLRALASAVVADNGRTPEVILSLIGSDLDCADRALSASDVTPPSTFYADVPLPPASGSGAGGYGEAAIAAPFTAAQATARQCARAVGDDLT